MTTIYRNYDVAKVGDHFVGQSKDDESVLISKSHARLMTAIDQMWASLERGAAPSWFSGSSAIDLDAVELDCDPGPESHASDTGRRSSPKVISYTLFGVTALLVSAIAALLMHSMSFQKRTDVIFTLGVCAVSVAFGRGYALLMTILSALVYNLLVIEPRLEFSVPTSSELAYLSINLIAAVAIPVIIKGRGSP